METNRQNYREKDDKTNQRRHFETCMSNLIDFTQASHSVPIASEKVIIALTDFINETTRSIPLNKVKPGL